MIGYQSRLHSLGEFECYRLISSVVHKQIKLTKYSRRYPQGRPLRPQFCEAHGVISNAVPA